MGRPRKYKTNADRQRAYRRRLRKPVYHRSTRQNWATPRDLFAALDSEFRFDLDAAAEPHNALCRRYYSADDDGLAQPWHGTVFCNPPYGRNLAAWVRKAIEAAHDGATVILLVPARTDTAWFHMLVDAGAEIRFLKGRLRFDGTAKTAPFPSIIVVLKRNSGPRPSYGIARVPRAASRTRKQSTRRDSKSPRN